MKLLSVAVPCYNSQDYMEHCVETLVSGGEEVEVIIVNDGSKDGTHDLAVKLSEKYPSIVTFVDQENGGHGEAVNTGLAHANGVFFKVVDSDDWVDEDGTKKCMSRNVLIIYLNASRTLACKNSLTRLKKTVFLIRQNISTML